MLRILTVPIILLTMSFPYTSTTQQPSFSSSPQKSIPIAAADKALKRVVDYGKALEKARAEQYLQEVAAKKSAEIAEIQAQVVHSAPPVVNTGSPTSSDSFLACTRAHESDSAGGYGAISPGGTYRGAYQFDQSTWNGAAAMAGRPDLIGADPATASSADQDLLASVLHNARGNQPWGGRC